MYIHTQTTATSLGKNGSRPSLEGRAPLITGIIILHSVFHAASGGPVPINHCGGRVTIPNALVIRGTGPDGVAIYSVQYVIKGKMYFVHS